LSASSCQLKLVELESQPGALEHGLCRCASRLSAVVTRRRRTPTRMSARNRGTRVVHFEGAYDTETRKGALTFAYVAPVYP
jgi:hypothetical protein